MVTTNPPLSSQQMGTASQPALTHTVSFGTDTVEAIHRFARKFQVTFQMPSLKRLVLARYNFLPPVSEKQGVQISASFMVPLRLDEALLCLGEDACGTL